MQLANDQTRTPINTMLLSGCCGAIPTELCNEDTGFCPDCRDHTEFVNVCDECSEQECVCPVFTDGEPVKTDSQGIIRLAADYALLFLFLGAIGMFILNADRIEPVLVGVMGGK